MKILHIVGNAKFGGIERLVITLVNQQLGAGKVTPGIMLSSMNGEFLEKFEQTGARLMSSNCPRVYNASIARYRAVQKLYADYDVLHFHYFNPFLAWCAVRSGKKIVFTFHGIFGFGRKTTASDRVKSVLKKRFLNNNVDHIMFNSDFTRHVAEERYGLSEDRFGLSRVNRSTLYNGVDVNSVRGDLRNMDPEIRRRLEHKFVIGTSSRFAGFKRIDRLIKAFSKVQKDRSDMVLLLVGDGATRPQLEAMVDNLEIGGKVIFAGYRSNVYDYQSAMDVCVFASVNEPFGLVAIETLLLGKPTLVFSDGGGLKEIIKGLSEYDVVNDIDALCSRIDFYYQNPSVIQAQKETCRKYARRFDAETMGNAYFDIYEKLDQCVT